MGRPNLAFSLGCFGTPGGHRMRIELRCRLRSSLLLSLLDPLALLLVLSAVQCTLRCGVLSLRSTVSQVWARAHVRW
jgi:hypothetical protein